MQQRFTGGILLGVVGFLLLPALAAAQSAIVGLVTDDSGAVLPGVTVEAASPALIEKVRSVTTDALPSRIDRNRSPPRTKQRRWSHGS